jgi:pimeloyl-ACP methyl ester carboxylesterase
MKQKEHLGEIAVVTVVLALVLLTVGKLEFPTGHTTTDDNFTVNHAPGWTGETAFTINGTLDIDLASHFFDPDFDSLTYLANAPAGLTVSIDGSTLHLAADSSFTQGTVTVFASDGKELGQADLTITSANVPPASEPTPPASETPQVNESAPLEQQLLITNVSQNASNSSGIQEIQNFEVQAGSISACGNLTGGVSTLSTNVTSAGLCFNFTANDAVLDCNGSTITYDTSGNGNTTSISVLNHNDIVIRNCTIQDGSVSGSNGYGITFSNVSRALVTSNTIITNGTTDNWGVRVINTSEISIVGNAIQTHGSGIGSPGNATSSSHGIVLINQSNANNISSNAIAVNGTGGNIGVFTIGTAPLTNILNHHTIAGNIITAAGDAGSNYGVYFQGPQLSASDNNITNNSITTFGANADGGVYVQRFSSGRIVNNTITTESRNFVGQSDGIDVTGNDVNEISYYNQVTDNVIVTNGTVNNYGINLQNDLAHTLVTNNIITTRGNGSENHGILIQTLGTGDNNVTGNTITTTATSSAGIVVLRGNAGGNFIGNNTITATGAASDALAIESANNTLANNTLLNFTRAALRIESAFGGAETVVNSSFFPASPIALQFNASNGTINFTGAINISTGINFSKTVNVSQARIFVNTTTASGRPLNVSARLTFRGIVANNPQALVKYDDTATNFASCSACSASASSGTTFTYTVPSFTTYSANESPSDCGTVTNSTTLLNDITGSGTCITVGASDITLDCDGHKITFNTGGGNSEYGVFSSGKGNITVKNCIVQDGNIGGAINAPVRLTNTNRSLVTNNTLIANGTNNDFALWFDSAHDNVGRANTITAFASWTNGFGVALGATSTGNRVQNNSIDTNGDSSSNLGIDLDTGSRNNTVDANLITTDGTNSNYGIYLPDSATYNSITNNDITTNGSTNANYGIRLANSAFNNSIRNNTITTGGTADNHGIHFQQTVNQNNISGNTINARGTSGNQQGIVLAGGTDTASDNLIESNTITTDSASSNQNYGIYSTGVAANNVFRNNTIRTNGTSNTNYGINIASTNGGILIEYNTITTNGTSDNYGITTSDSTTVQYNRIVAGGSGGNQYGVIFNADTNTLRGNNITSLGTTGGIGIVFNGVGFSTLADNLILVHSTGAGGSSGITFSGGAANIVSHNSNISVWPSGTYAIALSASATNLTFNNTVFSDNTSGWFTAPGSDPKLNFTNTTFSTGNGSVRIPSMFNISAAWTVDKSALNVTFNRARIDAATYPFLNKSAFIALTNLTFTNSQIVVDYADSGTNTTCPADVCTSISYSNGIQRFNVSHWTAFAAQENVSSAITSCPTTITTSSQIGANITAQLTASQACITFGAGNISLDCAGFTITSNGTGIGVNVTGRSNVTMTNCYFRNITEGAFIATSSSVNVFNVTVFNASQGLEIERSQQVNVTNASLTSIGTALHLILATNTSSVLNVIAISSAGEGVGVDGRGNTFINVTAQTNATSGLGAFTIGSGFANRLEFVRALSAGVTGNGAGLMLLGTGNNTVNNSFANSTNGPGLRLLSTGNIVLNTNISGAQAQPSLCIETQAGNIAVACGGITVDESVTLSAGNDESQFNNSHVRTGGTWLYPSLTGTVLTNTTFESENGSIRLIGSITPTSNTSLRALNISLNRSFVNASTFTFLNTSAFITLNLSATGMSNATPAVDFAGAGAFVTCPADVCTNQGFSNGILTFNVSHWTTFAGQNASVAAAVFNASNLSVTKSDAPDPVAVNGALRYNITVTSNGNGTAYNVTVNDSYSAQVSFINATPSPVTGTNTTFIVGNLTNGSRFTINITVNVSSALANATVINNTANVTWNNETGSLLYANASQSTTVLATVFNVSNISISKTDSPDPVNLNGLLTYTLTVTSNGNGTASGVVVTETYPSQVTFVSSQPTATGAGNATFSLGNLSAGAVFAINITVNASVLVSNGTVINNTANLTFQNETGATIARNANQSTTVLVPFGTSVNISTSATSGTAVTGSSATYTITVGNNGTVSSTYNLSVQNLSNADIVSLSASTITLSAGTTGTVTLDVGHSNTTGTYSTTVTAILSTNASITATTPTMVTIVTTPPVTVSSGSSPSCQESWTCGAWNSCNSGLQTRTCTDQNACGSTITQPSLVQTCTACTESWTCDSWSSCSGNSQSRSCVDGNGCGTTASKPSESQSCTIKPAVETPLPLFPTNALVCSGLNRTQTSRVVTERSNVDISQLIPAGYVLASPPVKLTCGETSAQFTLPVPDTLTDFQLLRCRGATCAQERVSRVDTNAQVCGNITLRESVQQEQLSSRGVLAPEKLSTFVSTYRQMKSLDRLQVDGYTLAVEGVPISVRLLALNFPIPQPANPSLSIIGTPLVIDLESPPANSVTATVTLPVPATKGIEPGSVKVYAFVDNTWQPMGGAMNDTSATIVIRDLRTILDAEKKKAVIATIGTTCTSCEVAQFLRAYHAQDARTAVVLIHGAFSNKDTYNFMLDDFRTTQPPFDVWTYDYPSNLSLEDLGVNLADALLLNANKYDQFYLVGHSAGALIVQQALLDAYQRGDPTIPKVKKAILVASPTLGSPTAQAVQNLLNNAIASKTLDRVFNMNSRLIQQTIVGKIIPRVPSIDYQVIAGTRPYDFNLGLLEVKSQKLGEFSGKNDGIITTDSAQRVGGSVINTPCKNYYELNLTHTDLIDNEQGIHVIERLITSDLGPSTPQSPLAGQSKYVTFAVAPCSPDDQYALVGKPVRAEKRYDPTGCSCGNGWCGDGETTENCPQDCAKTFTVENVCYGTPLITYILAIILALAALVFLIRHYLLSKLMGTGWLYGGTALCIAGIALTGVIKNICKEDPLPLAIGLMGLASVYVIAIFIERLAHLHGVPPLRTLPHKKLPPIKIPSGGRIVGNINSILSFRRKNQAPRVESLRGELEQIDRKISTIRRKK